MPANTNNNASDGTETDTEGSLTDSTAIAGEHGDYDPGREHDGPDGDRRSSLAELIRDANERGKGNNALVERVRASYDRDVPRRRVRRLVDAERERLARGETAVSIEGHAPRYVDCEDLARLTDSEFGRVVARLLGELDGRGEVTTVEEPISEPDGTDESGDAGECDADVGDVGDAEGIEVRWHREEGTTLVRAVADEPSRVVDSEIVCRVHEHGRSGRAKRTNEGERSDEPGVVGTAIVTVADVTPDAARLADRSDVPLYDRSAVRRWLDEAEIPAGAFGPLIEAP